MGRRLALLIGNTTFDNPETFPSLHTPDNDVQDFAGLLADRGEFEILDTLIDKTAEIVREKIDDLFGIAERGDLTLLYYSGHGYKGRDGRHYLITKNSRPDRLRSTAVAEWFIHDVMRNSRSRHRIIILDCCFSGAFVEGQKSGVEPLSLEELRGEATAILTSSGKIQYSFEESGRNSLFTRYLLLGIETGEADEDRDGYVSIDELFYYVEPKVIERRPDQTPMIYLKLREDKKLVVARSSVQPPVTAPRSELPIILDRSDASDKDILRPIWFAIGISVIALILAMMAIFGPLVNGNLSLTPPSHTLTTIAASTQAPTQVPEVLASTATQTPTPTPAPTNTPEPPMSASNATATSTSVPVPLPVTLARTSSFTPTDTPTSPPLPSLTSLPTTLPVSVSPTRLVTTAPPTMTPTPMATSFPALSEPKMVTQEYLRDGVKFSWHWDDYTRLNNERWGYEFRFYVGAEVKATHIISPGQATVNDGQWSYILKDSDHPTWGWAPTCPSRWVVTAALLNEDGTYQKAILPEDTIFNISAGFCPPGCNCGDGDGSGKGTPRP